MPACASQSWQSVTFRLLLRAIHHYREYMRRLFSELLPTCRQQLGLCCMGLMLTACEYFQPQAEVARLPVAQVKDTYLYADELEGILPSEASGEDSAAIVKRYVTNWVKSQLMLEIAEENATLPEQEIERKIAEYRYALLVYDYEKQYLEQRLDRKVTPQQVQDYYDNHRDDFQLKQNIVKGLYIKVAKEVPDQKQIRKWVRNTDDETTLEELRSYCLTYADAYLLNDTSWVPFRQLTLSTPFVTEIINPVTALKRKDYFTTTDERFNYYLKISDYKITDEISPLEFVEKQIEAIIINKRKIALRKAHKEEIYEQATRNEDYQIFR